MDSFFCDFAYQRSPTSWCLPHPKVLLPVDNPTSGQAAMAIHTWEMAGESVAIWIFFLKWWYPTTMGFPTKTDHFGMFWGYHHLRKHPYETPSTFSWPIPYPQQNLFHKRKLVRVSDCNQPLQPWDETSSFHHPTTSYLEGLVKSTMEKLLKLPPIVNQSRRGFVHSHHPMVGYTSGDSSDVPGPTNRYRVPFR